MNKQKLDSIIELASVLDRQTDFQEILRLVTQKAFAIMNARNVLVMMVNPMTRETIKTLYRQGRDPVDHHYQLLHTYLTGWVIENNRGFITKDIAIDRRFRNDLFEEVPVKSVMCAPFRGEGMITGTLLVINQSEDFIFGEEDFDILEKFAAVASPFLRNIQKIQQYFVSPVPQDTLINKYKAHGLLGGSEEFIKLLRSVEAAASSDVRILLEGESGTGKELVARAIHNVSPRASNKFIAVDCGAIPRELIESEMFGHLKGAFTGAGESRKGLMQEADGGTLFMDEITNLPLDVQAKFLRVLQENEIRPLGSNQVRKINVRFIAASSRSLRELVERGEFREDLFYRLYVYPIDIPSLSHRREDIPLLVHHFLRKFAREQQKKVENISGDLLEFLKNHPWTGNIRELENLLERLVTLTPPETKVMDAGMLPTELQDAWTNRSSQKPVTKSLKPLKESVAELEKLSIENALILCDWNQSRAARMLQISEHTIRYKMKKLGITGQH